MTPVLSVAIERPSVVVTPARGLHAVDGLLSGWHEPEASRLQLLEPVA